MVSQKEVDSMQMEISSLRSKSNILEKKYEERGKSLNKLWEKGKELKKEITELKNIAVD